MSLLKPDPSMVRRSFLKALSWETFSTLATMGLAYLIFGNWGSCLIFSLVCYLMKLALFTVHERLWHQIPYGKRPV
jgi:adenylylsulfate kinase